MTKLQMAGIVFASIALINCAGNTVKDAALTEVPTGGKPSSEAADQGAVSIEAKLAAAQQGTTDVTEVKFEKGSRTLSPTDLKKLENAFETAVKTRGVRTTHPSRICHASRPVR